MAKKKKIRRSVRGKGLAGLGGLLTGFLRMTARVFPWLLAAFAVAALFLAVRSALMADTSFGIQQVTVTPPQDISTAKRQALETRYLGKNILRIDLAKAAEDLEQDPEIEWAHVRRDFPSTLSIHIRRRVPMALIRFSPRGEYGLVSEDGMILEVLAQPNAKDLVIEAFSLGIPKPAIGIRVKSTAFRETARFIKAYWKKSLSEVEPISVLSLDPLGNVSAVLAKGLVVRLGRKPSGRIEAMEKLVPLLADENREAIEYVDLQFDDVVIKPKGTKR